MPEVTVRISRAVWETTTFKVTVPDGELKDWAPDGKLAEYVADNVDDFELNARDTDNAEISSGDPVDDIDEEVEILDAAGKVVYASKALPGSYDVTYRIRTSQDNSIVVEETMRVESASSASAAEETVKESVANDDPRFDDRIDPYIEIVETIKVDEET